MDDIDQISRSLNKVRVELVNSIQIQGFFDKMRSKGVLSLEDCQEMIVPSLYPTDRQKASHFLDVIATRGKHGFDVLVECLDEQYPHLYKTLTGKDPSPRPHMPKSPTVFSFTPGFGNMLEEISTQNYQLQHENAEKNYIIDKLTEERDYLASQQNMFAEKMENYQKVIQRTKQLEVELWTLKDELLDLFVRVSQTEKERDKFKELLKKKTVKLYEYRDKLERATNLLDSQRSYTQRADSKNTQLSHEKNNLQKEIHQIKLEMDAVRRQSLVFAGGSFSESIELDKDAVIDLLKQDKDAALREYEEASAQLCNTWQEIDDRECDIVKLTEENKDLQYVVEVTQKDLNATDKNYSLLCHELQTTNRNFKTVAEQNRKLQAEVDLLRQESEQRQTLLQEELHNYRTELHSQSSNMLTPPTLRRPISRLSFVSTSSSGISSMRGSLYDDTESNSNEKAETLPRVTAKIRSSRPSQKAESVVSSKDSTRILVSSRDSVRPMPRPRTQPIIKRGDSGLTLDKDTFPESQIPSADIVEKDEDNEHVTYEKIARHFANRPETFSESVQAHHGSWKKKDKAHYENVDVTLNEMRKTIIRPDRSTTKLGLHMSLAVDLDDESEELEKILSGKTSSEMNGHNGDVTPPLPAKKSHDPADRPPLPIPAKPKVTRALPHAMSQDEPRHQSVPNDFSPLNISPSVTRQRLGARRSNNYVNTEGLIGLRNGHNDLAEEQDST